MVVDGAGDEFLACAGLAQQQDGGVAWGDRFDELEDVLDGGAVADDLIKVQLAADLFFEIELLLGELVFEFRNLPVRQGIFEGDGYLARRLAEELDLL